MSSVTYRICISSNSSSDWKVMDNVSNNHFIINFPMITKQKLKDSQGNSVLKVFKHSSNPFTKYIASCYTNQVFGLEYNSNFDEFLFYTFKSNSCNQIYFSWKLSKEDQCIYLLDTNSKKLMGRIARCFNGEELASIQFYTQVEKYTKSALIFSGCILLNKSKILKTSLKTYETFTKRFSI